MKKLTGHLGGSINLIKNTLCQMDVIAYVKTETKQNKQKFISHLAPLKLIQ